MNSANLTAQRLRTYVNLVRFSAIHTLHYDLFDWRRDSLSVLPGAQSPERGPTPSPTAISFTRRLMNVSAECDVPMLCRVVVAEGGMKAVGDQTEHQSPSLHADGTQTTLSVKLRKMIIDPV